MRVLHYVHTPSGGHPRYTRELASNLAALGVPTVVIVSHDDGAWVGQVEEVLRAPRAGLRGARWALDRVATYVQQLLAFRRLLRRLHVGPGDVVHFQELPSLFPGLVLRWVRARGAATVLTVHNVEPHRGLSWTSVRIAEHQRRVARSCDGLLVLGEALKDALVLADPRIDPARVFVVDHQMWAVEPTIGAPDHDFLLFGDLRPNKGAIAFVEALARLGDPPASIVGAALPDQEAAIRDAISSRQLARCDLHLTFVDDDEIAGIFGHHRVTVLPYAQFGAQSGVLNLSVAYDRPVAVTDVGALGESVRRFGVGTIATGFEAEALGSAMVECLAGQIAGKYDQALEQMRSEVSGSAVAGQHLAVYQWLLEGRR